MSKINTSEARFKREYESDGRRAAEGDSEIESRSEDLIILTYARFQKLNQENEFHGHSLEEVWSTIKERLQDDQTFQDMIDYVLNDLGDG